MITRSAASSSSLASSTASLVQSWTYHVFLSFRGEDTRRTFAGHLHSYLVQKGIKTFKDDGLTRGEEISGSLFKAIEESRISVVVFSENYASSEWCLEELVKIMQCNESNRQIVYPIFYKVDPSDVRNQHGTFDIALGDHHDDLDKVMGWKTALTKAGNLSGRHFSHEEDESEFLHKVVEDISQQVLNLTSLNGDKYLVGIESRLEDICNLLGVGESDVRMVGIWGIGGLGKTTIARAVYNNIAHIFEGSCFVENVRERSLRSRGLEKLQHFLLFTTLGLEELKINSIVEGSNMIKEMLSHKRVLLVLDDVDDLDQLSNLARNSDWFGSGSRIIITTRDKHILRDVKQIYQVEKLSHGEAMELFNFNAFKGKGDMDDYIELINDVVRYSEGLPLVLEVMGSYLYGRSTDKWKDAIKHYKRDPKFHHFLKQSYDALDPLMKEVFLHIACFFKGQKKDYVTDILEGCELPKHGIDVLVEKGLLRITEANDIWMHDILEEMGKEIVLQESPEPGERSRLWLHEDVYHVFVHNTGTSKVKGIMVKNSIPHQQIPLDGESFLKLNYLQIFIISCGNIFYGDHVDYLPSELSLLDWVDCPLRYFPTNFSSRKLVVLKMEFSSSSLKLLQTGFLRAMPWVCISPLGNRLQVMQNLKSIELVDCYGITNTSDFSRFPSLVDLKLRNCKNVVKVDLANGSLKNLVNLEVRGSGKVQKFDVVKVMKSLKRLDLSETAITELSSSTIGYLINLEHLKLRLCKKLKYVPGHIFELQHLQLLDLSYCTKLVKFPGKSKISTESTGTDEKHYAQLSVNLFGCKRLVEITEFRREIYSLDVCHCLKLERISKLSEILEGKESRMIPRTRLSACFALYPILACEVSKMKHNLPDNSELTALFYFFFSCRQSVHRVLFYGTEYRENRSSPRPFPDMRIPDWFTCHSSDINFKGPEVCYFRIDFPGNFNWEDKGLAFCATTFDVTSMVYQLLAYIRAATIYINGVSIINESGLSASDGFVWLYYMPFDLIISRLKETGLPPPTVCRIKFEFEVEYLSFPPYSSLRPMCNLTLMSSKMVNCGVHVVMPEDDGLFINRVLYQRDVAVVDSCEAREYYCRTQLKRRSLTFPIKLHRFRQQKRRILKMSHKKIQATKNGQSPSLQLSPNRRSKKKEVKWMFFLLLFFFSLSFLKEDQRISLLLPRGG